MNVIDLPPPSRRSTIHFSEPIATTMGDDGEEYIPSSEGSLKRSANSRWRPRSISAMDGFSTAPNPGRDSRSPISHSLHPSIRDSFSNVNSAPSVGVDPPRPAKDGHEWVWFPAGYWAERLITELPPKDPIRVFKWHRRSGKSGSESPKCSPRTPFTAHSLPESRMEKSTDYLAERRSQTRTATSSETGGYYFPLNGTPDAPLPSPYLTEQTHVQSLQWPFLSTAGRNGSTSESSILKSRSAISPSPLHFSSADDDGRSEKTATYTPDSRVIVDSAPDTTSKGRQSPNASASQVTKPKKPLISWPLLSGHRKRLRRSQASSDENIGGNARSQPSPPQSPAKSSLRKESTASNNGRKKSRAVKLLIKAGWKRKFSGSSGASTSRSTESSVRNSVHSQSSALTPGSEGEKRPRIRNAWDTEYPGGEAERIRLPEPDRFPRSFFSDLTPPGPGPYRPLSRQDGRADLKKTTLSALSSASGGGDQQQPRQQQGPKPRPTMKEWWEVSVPVKYGAIDQRSAFRFDLPEHLPTSPMCPANKRHKSGGTGVCVYHGRAKKARKSASSPHVSGDEKEKEGGGGEEEDGEEDEDEGSDVWR